MAKKLESMKIAGRYARALFASCNGTGKEQAIADDLNQLKIVFETTPSLTHYIENPGVTLADKKALIHENFSSSLTLWVQRTLDLLLDNKRLLVVPYLADQFTQLLRERDHITEAEVITATELEAELRERIRRTLESTFGYQEVILTHTVNPSLIGGMVVKIRDQVIDGSYAGRLEDMRKQMGVTQ